MSVERPIVDGMFWQVGIEFDHLFYLELNLNP